jgi:hypothetical protein
MITHSTRTSLWIANAILSEPKLQRRRKVYKNMIDLCQVLLFFLDIFPLKEMRRKDRRGSGGEVSQSPFLRLVPAT